MYQVYAHIMQINNIAPIQTASAERLREMIDTIDEHLRMLKRLGIDTDAWSATVNVWKLQCLLDSEASVMQTRQKDLRVELVTSLLRTKTSCCKPKPKPGR